MASESKSRNWGKVFGIGVCVVALGAGGVWAGKYWLNQHAEGDLNARLAEGNAQEMRDALLSLDPETLDSEQGKKKIDITAERMKDMSFAEIMEVMRSKDLTEDERRKLREIGRELMMASVNKNVDEYFDAPLEQREAILDRHMDEWQEFREQMEAYREEHKDDPDDQAERERERQRWQKRDRQDAKERMEGGDPDRMKRMFAYWGKMRARAQARGIDMGRGSRGSQDQKTDGKKSERSKRGGRKGE